MVFVFVDQVSLSISSGTTQKRCDVTMPVFARNLSSGPATVSFQTYISSVCQQSFYDFLGAPRCGLVKRCSPFFMLRIHVRSMRN